MLSFLCRWLICRENFVVIPFFSFVTNSQISFFLAGGTTYDALTLLQIQIFASSFNKLTPGPSRVETRLHAFRALTRDGGECSASCYGHIHQRENSRTHVG